MFTILLKRIAGEHPLATIGIALLIGSVFLIPFAPTAASAVGDMPVGTWVWLVYLALVGTFFAYVIWFWSLKYLDASETSAYLYLVPVFALFWSLVILREAPPAIALLGGALVLGGVALTQMSRQPPALPIEP